MSREPVIACRPTVYWMQSPAHRRAVSGDPPPSGPWPRAVAGGGLCGGASHEAEGRCGARGGGAGREGPPTGWHRLRLLRQILDELVPGVEQFLLVDDVIAVEDGAALVPGVVYVKLCNFRFMAEGVIG